MSELVKQVEKAIEESVAVCNAEDGVCHATHVGGGTIRLMAEHGAAILAAVKLAEAINTFACQFAKVDGVSPMYLLANDASEAWPAAMKCLAAYRTAIKESGHE